MERNSKRKVKPSETLLNIEDIGESSDDSDFRIEDHCFDESDSSDSSDASNSSDGMKINLVFFSSLKVKLFFLLF